MQKITKLFHIYFFMLVTISVSCSISCANSTFYEHKVSQFKILSTQKNKHIAMLGDSITSRALWCELLSRSDISNRGIDGDSVENLFDRLGILNKNLRQVFIMIGINDILKGKNAQEVFDDYKKIINLLERKNLKIVLQSTLYIAKRAPKQYNENVKKLNNLLQGLALRSKLQYLNLNKIFAPNGFLLEQYSLDGLHLNGEAYVKWTKSLKPLLIK